ncbi:hypothetical protein F8388_026985 [Cannabis sativa]|uniref:Leucine-rich repeat-containing N-terminal plant-type domain-containing protein n=1 Tax=Cannabis sativa TaxID=3483 RepID=A0A7J6EDI9_CANSA|nr:hypothetical protein F8388_026985 [Cannabis sativa]
MVVLHQSSLFGFLLLLLVCFVLVRSDDGETLMRLKSTIDPLDSLPWRGSTEQVCQWKGVKECMNGRVSKLVLEYLNLTGVLDQKILDRLDQLRVLSFKGNSINGQMPDLSGLANLKSLFLNQNNFFGDFPASISGFHKLKVVVLADNQISGRIPATLLNLRRLYFLDLQNNLLTGEIPPFTQTSLRFFIVSNNKLSGAIPVTSSLVRFNSSSFSGNVDLCSVQIQNPCGNEVRHSTVFRFRIDAGTRLVSSSAGKKNGGAVLMLPATTGDGENGLKGGSSYLSRRPSQLVKMTAHAADGLAKSHRAVWFPKSRPYGVEKSVAISGFGGEKVDLGVRKEPESLPVLPSNSQVFGVNAGYFNFLTVREKNMESGPGVNGPCGKLIGQAGSCEVFGHGPSNKVNSNGNADNGLHFISSKTQVGGPVLEEIYVESNFNQGLVGPCILGNGSNSNGPTSLAKDKVGPVDANLSTNIHGAQEQLNEEKALAQFLNAKESLLHDLKHFGKLDLYEFQSIGGDIGVPASSEVNERTTPFKKRKFEASASLCSRPHKVPRKYPDVTALAPRAARVSCRTRLWVPL